MYDPGKELFRQPPELSIRLADMVAGSRERTIRKHKGFFARLKLLRSAETIAQGLRSYIAGFSVGDDPMQQFKEIADRMALAELLVAYTKDSSPVPWTRDDDVQKAVAEYQAGRMSLAEFKKEFGYYAEKPFDVSCKRYSEYSANEMRELRSRFDEKPLPVTKHQKSIHTLAEIRHLAYRVVAGLKKQS